MPSDNDSCLFVVTMTPGIANGAVNHEKVVGTVRNMNMGLRTFVLWPMWPVKVSHRVPVEWLGNVHGEKQVQDPGKGALWLFCWGEGQKASSRALSVLATNALKH